MTDEIVTTTTNPTAPAPEVARPVEHHTTIIREGGSSGGGMGWVLVLLLVAGLAFGGFYLMQQTRQSDSVSEAASKVGTAAEKVGEAAEDAADKITGDGK